MVEFKNPFSIKDIKHLLNNFSKKRNSFLNTCLKTKRKHLKHHFFPFSNSTC